MNKDTIIFEPAAAKVKASVEQAKDSPWLLWCRINWHRWEIIGRRTGGVHIEACLRCGRVREGMWT